MTWVLPTNWTREWVSRTPWPRDLVPVALLLLMTGVVAARLVVGGTLVGQDAATQFYPWYAHLGERLRAFDLPGWNPFQFGGVPFAADPQSGWMYLPAMILFTALPIGLAANALIVGHLLLAGLTMYALGRTLGLHPWGALVAAVSFECSGFVYGRVVCCLAQVEVSVWIPALLLTAERSLRAGSRRAAVWWAVGTGFVLSQIIAAWLGQGGLYAVLLLGAFLVYRSLIDPPNATWSPRRRLAKLGRSGGIAAAVATGLSAASVLPRLEYNPLSNVANGIYAGMQGYAAVVGGLSPEDVTRRLFERGLYYPGVVTGLLAVGVLVVARRRHAAPFFVVILVAGLILSVNLTTPLHALVYAVVPGFEPLHRHWPERIMLVGSIAPPLLAGITISGITGRVAHLGAPRIASALPVALTALVIGDFLVSTPVMLADAPFGGFHRVDLARYYAPTGASGALTGLTRDAPARYAGYDPTLGEAEPGMEVVYRNQFFNPRTGDLLVNNRAVSLGLNDAQGYNPVQLARFVTYLTALNGRAQEYHETNLLPSGIGSPLLDVLNVRYLVVPNRPGLEDELARYRPVYEDDRVRIVENPTALPRGWIVHEARPATDEEALRLLATAAVDPRQTALVEAALPSLAPAVNPGNDRVSFEAVAPDQITVTTETDAPGLLVLSELDYPAWRAEVDGQAVPITRTNGVFRGVPIPAGRHTVTFAFTSPALIWGTVVSFGLYGMLGAAAIWTGWTSARRGSRRPRWGRAVHE